MTDTAQHPPCCLGRRRFLTGAAAAIAGAAVVPRLALAMTPLTNIGANGCRINVSPVFQPFRYDLSKTVAEIDRLSKASGMLTPQGSHILGRTGTKPVMGFSTKFVWTGNPRSAVIAHVTEIELEVGAQENSVWISREVQAELCTKNAVVTHENRHVDVATRMAADYPPLALQRMMAISPRLANIEAPSVGAAKDRIDAILMTEIKDLMHRYEQDLHDLNLRIDTPAEYARANTVCDGHIPALLHRAGL